MIIEYMGLFLYQNQNQKLGLGNLGKRRLETGDVDML